VSGAASTATDDTPLMQQWREVKSRNRDALVLFRVGDFYEMFFEDAQEGSRLLGLTLTSRNNGAASRVPLAGIPVKALDDYLTRLIRMGRRVALCEQVEDPALAKGIVRREVVETVTPGTALHDTLLEARKNTYLVSVTPALEGVHGVAALDLSTGEMVVQPVPEAALSDELGRLDPAELLLPRGLEREGPMVVREGGGALRTWREDWRFDEGTARDELLRRYRVGSLDAYGFGPGDALLVRAAGALSAYVQEIQPAGTGHLRTPRILRPGTAMVLDEMTRRNLELVEPLRAGESGGTLVAVLDDTTTPMGARLLRRWILNPLVDGAAIRERLDAVGELVEQPDLRRGLRKGLEPVGDLERLATKVSSGRATPREFLGLARSLGALPRVVEAGAGAESPLLREVAVELDPMDDIRGLIEEAIAPDAPATLQDGGVIRPGHSPDLDELRTVRDGAVDFIASLQARERERTGITSLKVGYNRVFGYYLEVTAANLARVPDDYVRKQTLSNGERYFTPELKEWEEKVHGAEERIAALELELFQALRGRVAAATSRIQEAGERVGKLDVLVTLAEVAVRREYVRPEIHDDFEMHVREGRHPVVETMMPREEFIPNDLTLDESGFIGILTGPNMAGKSTVLRQVGLIQLLAQMGSFVPAVSARLPICDRIFTRVGASDNLARGQSTFMVEMNETASILHGATSRSLVLLDEIGRGTATYDGVSIAWAVTEHLHEHIGARTVFATHYHELTQLGDLLQGVFNLNVAVREVGDEIVFLRRLERGGADRSYGIQVARLAGLPPRVVARARELLAELEGTHSGGGEGLGRHGRHRPASTSLDQLSLFPANEHPVLGRLREMDIHTLTPLDALNLLAELRRSVTGERDHAE
jgi:DNA mismatch repair protein MutS